MEDKSAAKQLDGIIAKHGGWKGEALSQIRAAIHKAYPDVVEENKWRMKSRPEGLAVWSHKGILCFVEIWNDNVKLMFFKGAAFKDQTKFNARLKSKDIRAIEYKETDTIDRSVIKDLILEAVRLNDLKASSGKK